VITENGRVLDAVAALRQRHLDTLGTLLRASHASLRDDYEVSVPALEAMVAAAEGAPGCLGARMTGVGFGGAVLALVERAGVDAFVAKTASAYQSASGTQGTLMVCEAVGGAEVR
jgi:galactokinase